MPETTVSAAIRLLAAIEVDITPARVRAVNDALRHERMVGSQDGLSLAAKFPSSVGRILQSFKQYRMRTG